MVKIARAGIVQVAIALAHDELVLTAPEMRFVLFLASTKGHQWRTLGGKKDLDSVAESLRTPPRTLDRVIQRLRSLEVIQVEHPSVYRATYRLSDLFLARCEVVVEERFENTRRSAMDGATGGAMDGATVAPPVALIREVHPEKAREVPTQVGAAASGRSGKAVRMATDRDVDADFYGAPKKGQPRGPVGRLQAAFREMYGDRRPTVSSAGRQGANIKWLLEQGYDERTILESFKMFANLLPSLAIGPNLSVWDAYFQKRARLMKDAYHALAGGREGSSNVDDIAQEMLTKQRKQRSK